MTKDRSVETKTAEGEGEVQRGGRGERGEGNGEEGENAKDSKNAKMSGDQAPRPPRSHPDEPPAHPKKPRADQTACPRCGAYGCQAQRTDSGPRAVVRYRKCAACGHNFKTVSLCGPDGRFHVEQTV